MGLSYPKMAIPSIQTCKVCHHRVAIGDYGHFGPMCQLCIDMSFESSMENGHVNIGCYKCKGEHLSIDDVSSVKIRKQYNSMKRRAKRLQRTRCCETPDCGRRYTPNRDTECRKCGVVFKRRTMRIHKDFKEHGDRECPICGEMYVRIEGCNNITCTRCKFTSCFKCGSTNNNHECSDSD